jgi:uncharacterized protein YndB with AHSA1/START domain
VLVLERLHDAPRQLVFDVWSQCLDRLAQFVTSEM